MEGITGVVDGSQTGGDTSEYNYYRKMMAGDLNAAIDAALDFGVKEIIVSDAHGGMRNLQPEDVNEAAYLIRGSPKPNSMMEGIEEGFDAALYVGYHAMAGAEKAVLSHTISGSAVNGIFINGRETGEFGLNAALAGWYDVPSVFISGDEAVAYEAQNFVPEISTAIVKWAVGRLSAKCLHPKKARKVIYDNVKEALGKVNKIEPFWVNAPVEVRVIWSTPTMADAVSILPYMDRVNGFSTKAVFEDYPTALKGLRASISLAGTTIRR
ncbi:M55 family metallopeptidase [Candidatus Bathyarchaeota archaeon]|nr:M55 family metallopeptidase [Candidatus Bathyarchaeota archaeon]